MYEIQLFGKDWKWHIIVVYFCFMEIVKWVRIRRDKHRDISSCQVGVFLCLKMFPIPLQIPISNLQWHRDKWNPNLRDHNIPGVIGLHVFSNDRWVHKEINTFKI